MAKGFRRTLFALLLLVCVAALALWLYFAGRADEAPASNARFVCLGERQGQYMQKQGRVEAPLPDVEGNAGSAYPENEVYYPVAGNGTREEGGAGLWPQRS